MLSNTQLLPYGHFELFPVETGRIKLDGGAMFGIVPKTLWSRQIPTDEKNRILMGMRCLLIKSLETDRIYLVDNGCGDKFNEKMASIYGIDHEHSDLLSSLEKCGVSPGDITDIIFTHLHFDHCGGTTTYGSDGEPVEVFLNATYHVNKRHWETATTPNPREKASFFPENLNPIKHSGRLNLVDDHHDYEPGLSSFPMDGHTEGQQLPVIRNNGTTIVYAADLIPTAAHLPLPWIMGYDMAPRQTLTEKEDFLDEAIENGWYLFMEHDAEHEIVTVQKENGKYLLKNSLTLSDIT